MIEIIEFTDPVCTWCWGSEPVLRALEYHYKGKVSVGFIMGGLVEDMRDFHDDLNGIGGDLSKVNAQIASHWLEASNRHGMPVDIKDFSFFTETHTSTYPTNIAYKAAQFQGEELANRFLRRVREAISTEGKQANRMEVLQELVKEVGLDKAKWMEDMENGSAREAFEQDLALCRQFQIHAFPSYLVKNEEGKGILLRGFQSYENFKQAITKLSDGEIKEQLPQKENLEEEVKKVLNKYGKVAPIELEMLLDCSKEEMEALVEKMVDKGSVEQIKVGTGLFIV